MEDLNARLKFPSLPHWEKTPHVFLGWYPGDFFSFPSETAMFAASRLSFLSSSQLSVFPFLIVLSFPSPTLQPFRAWDQWGGGKRNWCLLSAYVCHSRVWHVLISSLSAIRGLMAALWEVVLPPFLWTRILRLVIKEITQKYTIRKWWDQDSNQGPFDSDILYIIPYCLQWAGSSAIYYSVFLWTKSPKVLNRKERVIDVNLSITHNVYAILLKPVLLYIARTC